MHALREGCFPAEGWQHPPHDYRNAGDGVTITMVKAEQYDSLPVFSSIHKAPIWQSSWPVYQVRTANGFCCYVGSFLAARDLVELAAAGRDGPLLWMQGETPEAAAKRARELWHEKQEERQKRRAGPEPPNIDLDLDIDI